MSSFTPAPNDGAREPSDALTYDIACRTPSAVKGTNGCEQLLSDERSARRRGEARTHANAQREPRVPTATIDEVLAR